MKKIIKLLSIGTLTSVTSLQVMACTDDSKYKTFLSDVDNSSKNSTAFFGFLGTANDDISNGLHEAISYWESNGFQQWKNQSDIKSAMQKMNLTNIELKEYQGTSTQDKQNDEQFWNDKSISWQRNIYKWILNHNPNTPPSSVSNNKNFQPPSTNNYDGKTYPNNLQFNNKDSDKNWIFNTLPIVFCIVKGQLYTAGEGWLPKPDPKTGPTPQDEINALSDFIIKNILSRG